LTRQGQRGSLSQRFAQSYHALVLQKGQVVLHGPSETLAASPELASYLGV
jgi:ABC-type branched-subunit amino acid transport system ATPase component